jgi:hypothetical protein
MIGAKEQLAALPVSRTSCASNSPIDVFPSYVMAPPPTIDDV